MNLVKYSLNGIYFDFYGVYVSESIGIADGLERKAVQSYDWAEYHGISVDLEKPKYKERKIELKCFIEGDNWQDLFVSFKDFATKEFSKSGTQRLVIEPFGHSPLVYDIFMQDGIKLEKRFNKGKMVGTFSLMLTEPNPIKRILYTTNSQVSISYNSPTETDIIIDGARYQGKEVVNFTKNLSPRVILSGSNYGRNLFLGKLLLDESDIPNASVREQGKIKVLVNTIFNAYAFVNHIVNAKVGEKYAISMDIRFNQTFTSLKVRAFSEYPNNTAGIEINSLQPNIWHRVSIISGQVVDPTKRMLIVIEGVAQSGAIVDYRDFKIEIGSVSTPFSTALEEQHFISLAGNIEDITNFTSNAEVLWEKI